MKTSALPEINWNSLQRRLLAVAIVLFRKEECFGEESVLDGLGLSPPDLVCQAQLEFFRKQNEYRLKTEEDCFRLIVTIMKNDFIDAVKNHSHQKTVISDDATKESNQTLEEIPASNDGFSEIEAEILAQSFYAYAEDDQELRDVIDAAAMLAVEKKDGIKRDDIAHLLEITPAEVTRRVEILKYRFARQQKKTKPKSKI